MPVFTEDIPECLPVTRASLLDLAEAMRASGFCLFLPPLPPLVLFSRRHYLQDTQGAVRGRAQAGREAERFVQLVAVGRRGEW